ncbi:LOW QUALITY PROTEIN: toll-like receptor 3 [Branchiostoma floridae x Branchiostoma belcheri]
MSEESRTTVPAILETCSKQGYATEDCSHLHLRQVPQGLPPSTHVLILSHNMLTRLLNSSFQGLSNLETLELGFNSISVIYGGAFTGLEHLTKLTLDRNQLKVSKLFPGVFDRLANLTTLDLSYNYFEVIPSKTFTHTSRLANLNLTHNSLTSLDDTSFAAMANRTFHVLNLSENNLEMITAAAFQPLKKIGHLVVDKGIKGRHCFTTFVLLGKTEVTSLSARWIDLRTLNWTTLQPLGTSSIQTLDLSNNALTALADNVFTALASLKTLQLQNNKIFHISSQAFHGLHQSLETLNMKNNTSTPKVIKPSMFEGFTGGKLTHLNLRQNNIQKISKHSFQHCSTLTILDLSHNNMDQRIYGEEFSGLPNLQDLFLSDNKNILLEGDSFKYVPTLKNLLMSRVQHKFRRIAGDPSPFQYLNQLTWLDLSHNNMDYIETGAFTNLSSLKELSLNNNNLYRLWEPGTTVLFLEGLTYLNTIFLSRNGFRQIHKDAFKNLTHLNNLYLSYNKINVLPNNLFQSSTKLSNLDLRNNSITVINKTVFDPFLSSLKKLYVAGNPLYCTCEMAWFRDWLNNTKADVGNLTRDVLCSYPLKLNKKSILNFDTQICRVNWEHVSRVTMIVTTTFIALYMIVGLLFRNHFHFYIVYTWYLVQAKIRRPQKIPNRGKKYDAFISYCSKDTKKWVQERLIPKLEEEGEPRFKLCIHERDFPAGVPIIENIINSIESSRKTVCLVTKNFLNSEWCKQEFYLAQLGLFEEKNDLLILIVMEDIPDYCLSRYTRLRRFMCQNTYLKWSESPNTQPLFWQRLRRALNTDNRPQRCTTYGAIAVEDEMD